jgi:hypothetical protein
MFPNLPGVPALSKKNALAAVVTLAAPLINNLLDKLKPVWGIYDSTGINLVIKPDSFLGFEYRNEINISNYPIEKGGFASYNKVKTPFDAIVKVSKGSAITSVGTSSRLTDRGDFIKTLDKMVESLDLYTVVTPEATYFNVNLEKFEYRRELKNGTGIIIADLHLVEIMTAIISTSSNNTFCAPDPVACQPSAQLSQENGLCTAGSVLPTSYSGH